MSRITTSRAATVTALAALVALAGEPAGAAPRPRVDAQGMGTFTTVDDGTVAVAASTTGDPFDATVTATLVAHDGSLPEPGVCEPATASMRLDGARRRFVELVSSGNVCGKWLQPPTSIVTHVFTGRYDVTASSQRRLVGTDGFHSITLADNGTANVLAIDT